MSTRSKDKLRAGILLRGLKAVVREITMTPPYVNGTKEQVLAIADSHLKAAAKLK